MSMKWRTSRAAIPPLCGLLALAAYFTSLAPTITWHHGSSDSGELATAAYYLGVAHPTGYPTYVLLGWLFTHLPVGAVAYRSNLLSAFAAAGAVAGLALILAEGQARQRPLARLLGAAAGALMLAFSPMFWSQAVVTEVYALNALFVALVLLLQERCVLGGDGKRLSGLLGLALGVGAGNHVTIGLILPGVALRLWPRARHAPLALLIPLTLGLLLGASVYLLLPFRAAVAPPFASWGDVRSWDALRDHVTGAAYRGALFSLPADLVLAKIPALARMLLEQFGWTGYVLAILGVWAMAEKDKAFLLAWGVDILLYLVFALNYSVLDSQVYLLPAFFLMALAAGWGVAGAVDEVARRYPARSLSSVAVAAVLLGLVAGSFFSSRSKAGEAGDWEAYSYAVSTLDSLPEGTLLITREDTESFSLWYAQYVEGRRRDVAILDGRLLSWPWYQRNIARTYPNLVLPPLAPLEEVRAVVAENVRFRPVFLTFGETSLPTAPEGQLYRVDPRLVASSRP